MDDDDLAAQVEALEDSLGGARKVAESFDLELRKIGASMSAAERDARSLQSGITRGLRGAMDGLLFDGVRFSDALRDVGRSLLSSTYRSMMNPVTSQLGKIAGAGIEALTGSMPFADGAPFAQGRVMPFARGGVVSGPTHFPMRGGTGLMGEAGPEAIMPLTRGSDGRLGVRSEGGGARNVSVSINVSTPDVAGFERSQSQIAARLGRMISQGNRNR